MSLRSKNWLKSAENNFDTSDFQLENGQSRFYLGSKIQISQFNFLHFGINAYSKGSSNKSVFGTKIHLEFHFIIEKEMHLDGGAVF